MYYYLAMNDYENDDQLADLVTKIYNRLCQMIRHGELKPGQKLIQTDLSNELGVSRTPLLQALNKLNGDHFVVNVPRHGSYVRAFSHDEIIGLLELRLILEKEALSTIKEVTKENKEKLLSSIKKQEALLANSTPFYDEDVHFHLLLVSLSPNPVTVQLLEPFAILYQTENKIKSPEESLKEHKAIVDAVLSGEYEKAAKIIREHLECKDKETLRGDK